MLMYSGPFHFCDRETVVLVGENIRDYIRMLIQGNEWKRLSRIYLYMKMTLELIKLFKYLRYQSGCLINIRKLCY